MQIHQAIILGLVEGITEYLPISSTGHLIITAAGLGLHGDEQSKQAADAFTIVIQGGAILAVLGLYRDRIIQMLRGILQKDAVGWRLIRNLFVAFLPAAMLGPLLNDRIEEHLFHPKPVIFALALGGAFLIGLDRWQKRVFHGNEAERPRNPLQFVDLEHLTWKRALVIGLLQCIAMWPGTSRSMMTIVGGMIVGLRPKQAAEFSFLLALPTLGGACAYKLVQMMQGDGDVWARLGGPLPIAAGMITAFVSAALAVKWLVGYLGKHGLTLFGWYRLVLAAVIAALLLSDVKLFG